MSETRAASDFKLLGRGLLLVSTVCKAAFFRPQGTEHNKKPATSKEGRAFLCQPEAADQSVQGSSPSSLVTSDLRPDLCSHTSGSTFSPIACMPLILASGGSGS